MCVTQDQAGWVTHLAIDNPKTHVASTRPRGKAPDLGNQSSRLRSRWSGLSLGRQGAPASIRTTSSPLRPSDVVAPPSIRSSRGFFPRRRRPSPAGRGGAGARRLPRGSERVRTSCSGSPSRWDLPPSGNPARRASASSERREGIRRTWGGGEALSADATKGKEKHRNLPFCASNFQPSGLRNRSVFLKHEIQSA